MPASAGRAYVSVHVALPRKLLSCAGVCQLHLLHLLLGSLASISAQLEPQGEQQNSDLQAHHTLVSQRCSCTLTTQTSGA